MRFREGEGEPQFHWFYTLESLLGHQSKEILSTFNLVFMSSIITLFSSLDHGNVPAIGPTKPR